MRPLGHHHSKSMWGVTSYQEDNAIYPELEKDGHERTSSGVTLRKAPTKQSSGDVTQQLGGRHERNQNIPLKDRLDQLGQEKKRGGRLLTCLPYKKEKRYGSRSTRAP